MDYNELERKLREAAALRDIDPRAASTNAVEALLEFVCEARPQWTAEQLHRPLVDLLAGLKDLDKGRRVPLLTPPKFSNRHPDDALLQMMRGHVIVAIERLVTTGESASAAAEQVAKVWNEHTGETKSALTIKSWYDRRDRVGKRGDLAIDVLTECRVLWDTENLDEASAHAVKDALRKTGLSGNLGDYLPRTAADILQFLARVLNLIKPGHG